MALCARAEKSSGDAKRLLTRWGVDPSEHQSIIERLTKERFIDDNRFATLYIREKSRLNGWGGYKIRAELQRKGIAREIIEEHLASIDAEAQQERLAELIERRVRTTKYNSKYHLKGKLIRYGASLGYNFEVVNDVVNRAIEGIAEEGIDEVENGGCEGWE